MFYSDKHIIQMESVITQILDVLSTYYPNEYELLKVLALDGNEAFKAKLKIGDNIISHLTGYHLIKKDSENDYYISINSVKEYLKETHKYDITLTADEDKWAQITRRRGAIEKSLRKLIETHMKLNFGAKARDTIFSYIEKATTDKNQLARFTNAINLEKAMEELYFSQLKIIITKEWQSFQKLFANQTQFTTYIDYINEYRKDAHAKSILEDDFATLHIAFSYFESRLNT